ncbi:BamA/TamA family outer membrane protein [Ruegeria marina]|nr:BamA/TamA family outer membrane protein [Ruegeria marina]
MSCVLRNLAFLALACAAAATAARAQVTSITGVGGSEVSDAVSTETGARAGSFIVAPIPFSNPVLESGLTLGAGYLFTVSGSRPSGFGAAKMKSGNGSEGYGAGGVVNFADGRWTLGLVYGNADLNYDLPATLPGVRSFRLPLDQSAKLAALELGYNFSPSFSVTGSLTHLDSTIAFNTATVPAALLQDTNVEVGIFGLRFQWDTRDDTFYPTTGDLTKLSLSHARDTGTLFGGKVTTQDRQYSKAILSAASYWSLENDAVIAVRGVVCGASASAPFFDACGVGAVDGMRGFPATDNIRDYSASIQAEYRDRFGQSRFGYVLFGGYGVGGNDPSNMSDSAGGAAVGTGLRFRLSRKFALDYALDFAVNDEGQQYVYVYLGQRF